MLQTLKIIALCVLCAVAYGIMHDQITIRICPEYFTIGHPPIFPANNLTLLAIVWGVVATWWVGAGLGIVLAVACRVGRRPKAVASQLIRPLATLILVSGIFAAAAGVVGHVLARNGGVRLVPRLAQQIPQDAHVGFLTDLWIHNASYFAGLVGGLMIASRIWKLRGRWQDETEAEV